MSLSNIRDSMVKNQFVGEMQSRPAEVQRQQEAAAQQTMREQAREAEEVIVQLSQAAEQNAIRDEDRGRGRNPHDDDEEGEPKPYQEPEPEDETPPNVGSHRLDVTA